MQTRAASLRSLFSILCSSLAEMKQQQKAMTRSSARSIISKMKDQCVPKKNLMKHLWFKGCLNFFFPPQKVLGEKWVTLIISASWSFYFLLGCFWKFNQMYIFHKQVPGIIRLELHHSVNWCRCWLPDWDWELVVLLGLYIYIYIFTGIIHTLY